MHNKHLASFITGYLSNNRLIMTSIAQLFKTSEYVRTGRYPVQTSVVFLNELITSIYAYMLRALANYYSHSIPVCVLFISQLTLIGILP